MKGSPVSKQLSSSEIAHKERAIREVVPGARIRIISTPRGLFDEGAELIIDFVDVEEDWVYYHYPEGVEWTDPNSGEVFPMGEMFGQGQTGFSPFWDPDDLEWKVIGTGEMWPIEQDEDD